MGLPHVGEFNVFEVVVPVFFFGLLNAFCKVVAGLFVFFVDWVVPALSAGFGFVCYFLQVFVGGV